MNPPAFDFNQQPFIVIWETTRVCDLACVHCRAAAQLEPLPGELAHAEAMDLVDQVAAMGTFGSVFSGGDPLKRLDLLELLRHGKRRGVRVGTIPAATPRLTLAVVQSLKEVGLDQMALSLDFSVAEAHDRFRGVHGVFDKVSDPASARGAATGPRGERTKLVSLGWSWTRWFHWAIAGHGQRRQRSFVHFGDRRRISQRVFAPADW